MDRIEPVEPIDRIDPLLPMDRIEPVLPIESSDPSRSPIPGVCRAAAGWIQPEKSRHAAYAGRRLRGSSRIGAPRGSRPASTRRMLGGRDEGAGGAAPGTAPPGGR
ncbi:hypothetical protein GCM10023403_29170 [Pseudonocardia benzenivorans]|nr:hypothetical protein PSD17_14770 [Pseudonocardia sp. D17]